MVIFCKASSSTDTLTFRAPTKADFLGSSIRQDYLLPRYEVFTADFYQPSGETTKADGEEQEKEGTKLVTYENMHELRPWQEKSAIGHWDVMRTVFGAKVWEDW